MDTSATDDKTLFRRTQTATTGKANTPDSLQQAPSHLVTREAKPASLPHKQTTPQTVDSDAEAPLILHPATQPGRRQWHTPTSQEYQSGTGSLQSPISARTRLINKLWNQCPDKNNRFRVGQIDQQTLQEEPVTPNRLRHLANRHWRRTPFLHTKPNQIASPDALDQPECQL